MLIKHSGQESAEKPFQLDHFAGMGASIVSAMEVFKAIQYRLDYLHGNNGEIPPDQLNYFQKMHPATLQHSITQGFIFVINCATDHLKGRQPARDSKDYINRLKDGFEGLYGLLDDIECHGVSLGRIVLFLAEIERYREELRAIKEALEAQESTQDLFSEVAPA